MTLIFSSSRQIVIVEVSLWKYCRTNALHGQHVIVILQYISAWLLIREGKGHSGAKNRLEELHITVQMKRSEVNVRRSTDRRRAVKSTPVKRS